VAPCQPIRLGRIFRKSLTKAVVSNINVKQMLKSPDVAGSEELSDEKNSYLFGTLKRFARVQ